MSFCYKSGAGVSHCREVLAARAFSFPAITVIGVLPFFVGSEITGQQRQATVQFLSQLRQGQIGREFYPFIQSCCLPLYIVDLLFEGCI